MRPSALTATGLLLTVAFPLSGSAATPPEAPPGSTVVPVRIGSRQLTPGSVVKFSGDGCAPGQEVAQELYAPNLQASGAPVLSGPQGSFDGSVSVPANSAAGRAWIRATCQDPAGNPRVMQVSFTLSRPAIMITWLNIVYGAGTALLVAGLGLALLRQPPRRTLAGPERRPRGKNPIRRRRAHKRRRRRFSY